MIIDNFLDLSGQEHLFKDVNIAYFCLAVYAGKVSKKEYREITVDYPRVFAGALKSNNPNATFCLFSAAGADSSEKSRMMFARDKGVAENVVLKHGFPESYIFRPAYIYPVEKRKEPSLTYRITRGMYPLLKAIYPAGVITSEHLGRAMFTIGLKGGDRSIYENKEILAIET